jgi:hypothetical protein
MSAVPTLHFWAQLIGLLALEISIIVTLAFTLQRYVQRGAWRRTIWQIALLASGLIALLELTGLSRAAMSWRVLRPESHLLPRASITIIPKNRTGSADCRCHHWSTLPFWLVS